MTMDLVKSWLKCILQKKEFFIATATKVILEHRVVIVMTWSMMKRIEKLMARRWHWRRKCMFSMPIIPSVDDGDELLLCFFNCFLSQSVVHIDDSAGDGQYVLRSWKTMVVRGEQLKHESTYLSPLGDVQRKRLDAIEHGGNVKTMRQGGFGLVDGSAFVRYLPIPACCLFSLRLLLHVNLSSSKMPYTQYKKNVFIWNGNNSKRMVNLKLPII